MQKRQAGGKGARGQQCGMTAGGRSGGGRAGVSGSSAGAGVVAVLSGCKQVSQPASKQAAEPCFNSHLSRTGSPPAVLHTHSSPVFPWLLRCSHTHLPHSHVICHVPSHRHAEAVAEARNMTLGGDPQAPEVLALRSRALYLCGNMPMAQQLFQQALRWVLCCAGGGVFGRWVWVCMPRCVPAFQDQPNSQPFTSAECCRRNAPTNPMPPPHYHPTVAVYTQLPTPRSPHALKRYTHTCLPPWQA